MIEGLDDASHDKVLKISKICPYAICYFQKTQEFCDLETCSKNRSPQKYLYVSLNRRFNWFHNCF